MQKRRARHPFLRLILLLLAVKINESHLSVAKAYVDIRLWKSLKYFSLANYWTRQAAKINEGYCKVIQLYLKSNYGIGFCDVLWKLRDMSLES